MNDFFRVCSTCRTPIAFESRYYVCSVSTCNRKATALYFCSVPCWDAHVPDARHRDAWAEEETAPSQKEWQEQQAKNLEAQAMSTEVKRRVVTTAPSSSPNDPPSPEEADLPREVLVVVSKLKAYIRARSQMNTSDGVTEVLSEHLRALCKQAIRSAAANSRKTVLARDFEAVLEGKQASE